MWEYIKGHLIAEMVCAGIGAFFGIVAFIVITIWDDVIKDFIWRREYEKRQKEMEG